MLLAAALLVGCGDSSGDSSNDGGVAVTTSPTTTQVTSTSSSTSGLSPASRSAAPVYLPPFISRTAWAQTDQGPSLQVFPTESGRYTPGGSELDAAWSEVVAMDPTADTPGMRDQFACHWRFARLVAPEKTSWNLEPWRPVVTEAQMIAAQCNPGAPEEQIP
ncbi:UNVERIFIED_CONTAM: uncharacterized protein DUF2599 [Williamsia faeni]